MTASWRAIAELARLGSDSHRPSTEETAAGLSIILATVRSRYFRARSLLRESLEADLDHALDEVFSFDGARCDRIVEAVLHQLRAEAGP